MKLWWVHLEAMVATLMVFDTTKEEKHWDSFEKVFKYSLDNVGVSISSYWCSDNFPLVSSARRRMGWLPGQTGESQDGFQGGPLQRLLPPAQGTHDL
jgi:hypothetical protein